MLSSGVGRGEGAPGGRSIRSINACSCRTCASNAFIRNMLASACRRSAARSDFRRGALEIVFGIQTNVNYMSTLLSTGDLCRKSFIQFFDQRVHAISEELEHFTEAAFA